jgi:hypothetical protein
VVHVPSVEAEAQRPLPRDLELLTQERARPTTRSKGLRRSPGGRLTTVSQWPAQLAAVRRWDGSPLPGGRRRRFLRGDVHHQCLREQMSEVAAARRAARPTSQEANIEQGRQVMPLSGIGINGAWVVGREFFGGRACKHRREVGG